ncbi:hypothetical protein DSUL_50141 [Desulfovibrionales bacterium]
MVKDYLRLKVVDIHQLYTIPAPGRWPDPTTWKKTHIHNNGL